MLNLLNETDRHRFEVHMMNCEFCRLELSKADSKIALIGDLRQEIVDSLREQGITFEGLKKELVATKKKQKFLQKFFGERLDKINLFLRPRVLLPVGLIAIVLLTMIVFRQIGSGNVYLSMLSFEKFPYQELSTRTQTTTPSMSPLFLKGIKFYNEDDFKSAAKILKEATQESPERWEYWFYLGVSNFLNKQPKPAIMALSVADKLNRCALEIEIKWYLAQAHLLNEDSENALVYLHWLENKPSKYSSNAKKLIDAIQNINTTSE
jgi:hypothetical protein